MHPRQAPPSEEPAPSQAPAPPEEPVPSEEPKPSEEPEVPEVPAPSETPEPTEEPQTSKEPEPSAKPEPVIELCSGCARTDGLTAHQANGSTAFLCDTCYQNLKDTAARYMPKLEEFSAFYTNYGLCDIDKNGIPELIMDQGVAIYSYSPSIAHCWCLFESMVIMTIHVDTQSHRMLAIYSEGEAVQYYLYEMVQGQLEEREVKTSWFDKDFSWDTYHTLLSQMDQIEYTYVIGDEASLLADLITALTK